MVLNKENPRLSTKLWELFPQVNSGTGAAGCPWLLQRRLVSPSGGQGWHSRQSGISNYYSKHVAEVKKCITKTCFIRALQHFSDHLKVVEILPVFWHSCCHTMSRSHECWLRSFLLLWCYVAWTLTTLYPIRSPSSGQISSSKFFLQIYQIPNAETFMSKCILNLHQPVLKFRIRKLDWFESKLLGKLLWF